MTSCVDGRHTIIIPHRDRHKTLAVCLWAIALSARRCNVTDYEVLVVDNGSQSTPTSDPPYVRVVPYLGVMPEFNKPILQNRGIDTATGDVLTFLDADAVVGPRFMDNPPLLRARPEITKFCYRVRILHREETAKWLGTPCCQEELYDGWFSDYDSKARGFEAYNVPYPGTRPGEEGGLLFGNSQFSIRREVLGDLRFDEGFPGHGFEDLIFNWWLHKQRADSYNPVLVSDADHAVFCLQHLYDDGHWLDGKISRRNEDLYKDTIEGRREYGTTAG